MKISIRKLKALCKKDLIDFFKNPSVCISVLIPVLFVVFYKYINLQVKGEDKTVFLLNFGVIMNCVMGGMLIASTTISEEKEKFTLRTLILSNVSSMEFLISKITVSFIMTMAGNLIIFFLSEASINSLPGYLIGTILCCIAITMISAVVGMVSRDQMSCGVLQIPVMMVLMLPTLFGGLNGILGQISKAMPITAALKLFYLGETGKLFGAESIYSYAVLFLWIAVSIAAFTWIYKIKGIDN